MSFHLVLAVRLLVVLGGESDSGAKPPLDSNSAPHCSSCCTFSQPRSPCRPWNTFLFSPSTPPPGYRIHGTICSARTRMLSIGTQPSTTSLSASRTYSLNRRLRSSRVKTGNRSVNSNPPAVCSQLLTPFQVAMRWRSKERGEERHPHT